MQTFDTNIIVRVLVEDDPEQSALALRAWQNALEAGGVFLPKIVLVEVIWVLSRAYHFDRPSISKAVDSLLHTLGVCVEDEPQAHTALNAFAHGRADFSDYLILESARALDALPVHTFDRGFASLDDVELLTLTI